MVTPSGFSLVLTVPETPVVLVTLLVEVGQGRLVLLLVKQLADGGVVIR